MTRLALLNRLCTEILGAFLLMAFITSSAIAKALPTLYEISLPCQTQQEVERQALFTQGFIQILGRLSSDPQIASTPAVKNALKHIVDYVDQYTYENKMLMVRFNESMMTELLGKTGATVWGSNRPQVVLWLALEQQNERHLVGAETDPEVHHTLKQLAQKEGLPLVLPLMDLEDVSSVTVTDVWGQFTDVLSKASRRYHAEVLLIGRVKQNNNQWQSEWTLRHANTPTKWHSEGGSLDAVVQNALEKTAYHLRQQLSVNTDSHQKKGQPLLVGIQGIRSRTDFKNVSRYLSGLNGIESVEVQQVIGDTALFEIVPYGNQNKTTFAQKLNQEQHLTAAIAHQSLVNVDLVYEWEP